MANVQFVMDRSYRFFFCHSWRDIVPILSTAIGHYLGVTSYSIPFDSNMFRLTSQSKFPNCSKRREQKAPDIGKTSLFTA